MKARYRKVEMLAFLQIMAFTENGFFTHKGLTYVFNHSTSALEGMRIQWSTDRFHRRLPTKQFCIVVLGILA